MAEIRYAPIGVIHSPFKETKGMPIQPTGARGVAGTVEVNPDFGGGLKDLEGFSYIFLIYHFHLSQKYSLMVKPFLDDGMRGVFATRAPNRPNSIGISVVRLVRIEGSTLHIEDVDIVDGTPLLDIKPYVPEFDARETERIGWLAGRADKVTKAEADDRFK
ncbi:MAG: tRNA (N6-threonylcarbamoyladenosine(37)-N6)-methyltransferase TrmO [Syntrophobacterales bacterium]|jgi:tRNA-Thr(GGU) m(6)t(6)A37 methyltransferase TsaA